jgi:hypothetical protein
MRSTGLWRMCVAASLATLLLAGVSAFAKDGRDFAGFYSVHSLSQQGDRVQFTMHLEILNFSDSDVKQAVVSLRENTGLVLDGTTKPIKLLPNRGTAKLDQRFTVSRNEYDLWHAGAQPTMFIIYESKGKQLTKYIQLAPK